MTQHDTQHGVRTSGREGEKEDSGNHRLVSPAGAPRPPVLSTRRRAPARRVKKKQHMPRDYYGLPLARGVERLEHGLDLMEGELAVRVVLEDALLRRFLPLSCEEHGLDRIWGRRTCRPRGSTSIVLCCARGARPRSFVSTV